MLYLFYEHGQNIWGIGQKTRDVAGAFSFSDIVATPAIVEVNELMGFDLIGVS